MKVLLLGEYSGVHTNLAKALRDENHEVTLVHDGDSFKKFPADFYIKYKMLEVKNRKLNLIIKFFYYFLNLTGFCGILQIFKYINVIKTWKNYDVVQLINPIFINGYGSIVNLFIFIFLRKNNDKVFLCALGDDYYYIKYGLSKKLEYSIYDNLKISTSRHYLHSLKYLYGFLMPFLNKYIVDKVDKVIPGLYDYYQAYRFYGISCSEIVPIIVEYNPDVKPLVFDKYPIKIFHGRQLGRELTKGDLIFVEAIKRLKNNYAEKLEYHSVSNVPYDEYIKLFKDCYIFFDQCYSYDCGVNALLGMREGKVVFSGFEEDFKNYLELDYYPLINALPNVDYIYKEIENLLNNPNLIGSYSEKALIFIKNYHNKQFVLDKYYQIWQS